MVDFGKIKIYPNPFDEQISIFLRADAGEEVQYRVSDMNGKLILQGNLKDGLNLVKMPKMPRGVYLLSFMTNKSNLQYPAQRIFKN